MTEEQVRIAGTSTAWWGTVLLLLVLSSMLSTLLFAYPYLGAGAERWGPRDGPPLLAAAVAGGLALLSLLPAMALHRAAGRGRATSVSTAALITAVLGIALIAAGAADLAAAGVSATEDAYGSVRVVTSVFHLAVAVVAVLVLLALPLRVWAGELGPRQRTAAVCAALLWYYVAGGWLVVSAVVHVGPAVGG